VQTVADTKLCQQPLLDATKKMTTHNTQTRKGFRWLCALVTVITLALPHLAFGFFDEDEPNIVIIMQQSQFVPNTEPRKPAKKGIYVQPQWVDGGYGVQVLEAGHWTDPEKEQPLTRRPE